MVGDSATAAVDPAAGTVPQFYVLMVVILVIIVLSVIASLLGASGYAPRWFRLGLLPVLDPSFA